MTFLVIGKTYKIEKKFLEKVAQAAFSYFEKRTGKLEFAFVTSEEIKRLNNVYRGKNKATDVLSFILEEEPLLAQIFICYNISSKQAKLHNKKQSEEVAHLLVHGILHCYGYDHEQVDEETNMKTLEANILNKVGVEL